MKHFHRFYMKNIAFRTTRALGAAVKSRRLELGWSQAKLADQLRVQRQWVIRMEAGGDGAEIGTVLRALNALGLSIVIGNEPWNTSERSAPAAKLDEVFARLKRYEPLPIPGAPSKAGGRKSADKT